jgi:hypothetical protein
MIRSLVFACAALIFAASPALAQDEAARAQAREQFGLGVQRYEAGQYSAALEAFQEAFRLAPHPTVHVNMANCYEHLNRPLEAVAHFERFLADAEGAPRQQRREVEAAVRRLRGQLGELRLSIAPDGATVSIDATETRRAPILEPIRVTAGTHRIEVRMDGYATDQREVTLAPGESQRVTIRLERARVDQPVAVAPEPAQPEPATEPSSDGQPASVEPEPVANVPEEEGTGFTFRLTTPVIAAGAATIGLTLGAVISGSIALAANSDFENAVARSNDPSLGAAERNQARQDGLNAAGTANTASVVTDIFIIGAVAAAGVTVFFIVVDGLSSEPEGITASSGVRLTAAPSVGTDGGGLVLAGSF